MSDRILRLTRIIKQQVEIKGGCLGLEQAIRSANPNIKAGGVQVGVSRHKLKQIAEEDENVVLKLWELRALDRYLTSLDCGLSLADKPIFEKLGILEALKESGPICFILGSRANLKQHVHELRRWDCRAMAVLMHDMGKQLGHVNFDFEDIPGNSSIKRLVSSSHPLLGRQGPSLISIGSTRACLATEILLARMFNQKPFGYTSPRAAPPPFSFVWSPNVRPSFPSGFSLTAANFAARLPGKLAREIRRNQAWALMVGSRGYRVGWHHQTTTMYGIVAAQRRQDGKIYLVVAGISGPATYAAAQLVRQIADELPYPMGKNAHGQVLWAAIKVPVTTCPSMPGDNRRVGKADFLVKPQTWP
ncbi:MAG: hypothetical protein JXQ71_05030 [Verrucomicrobia bacterium]|nr:hypothetical protein [Verrucomicrobiota bacterium]